jgi:hypothetical protein
MLEALAKEILELHFAAQEPGIEDDQSLSDFLTSRQADTNTTAINLLRVLGGRQLARFVSKFLEDFPPDPSAIHVEDTD